jgi:hypothetical protein
MTEAIVPHRAPQALRLVAYSFMVEGFLCLASMVAISLVGKVFINPGVFAALVGWGLLKMNVRSFRWACFLASLYHAMAVLAVLFLGLPALVILLNAERKDWINLIPLTFGMLILVLKQWQIAVLYSPPARRAFGLRNSL